MNARTNEKESVKVENIGTTSIPKDENKLIDYERSVYVQGDINEDLVRSLTPRILELRKNSAKPITVFIDSHGGDIRAAEIILGLLTTPDQFGKTCWINSVVIDHACNEAANLLLSGNYILAYPGAYILGIGRGFEMTPSIQGKPYPFNNTFEERIAGGILDRMVGTYFICHDEIRSLQEGGIPQVDQLKILVGDGTIDIPALGFFLFNKLGKVHLKLLTHCIDETIDILEGFLKCRKAKSDLRDIPPAIRVALEKIKDKDIKSEIMRDLLIINHLMAGGIDHYPDWSIETLNEIGQKLSRIKDKETFWEKSLDILKNNVNLIFPEEDVLFLREHLYEENKIPEVQGRVDKIMKNYYGKVDPLWSFSLTLCHHLPEIEGNISTGDAWLLGLIDEVFGNPYFSRRAIREKAEKVLAEEPSLPNVQWPVGEVSTMAH